MIIEVSRLKWRECLDDEMRGGVEERNIEDRGRVEDVYIM